MPYPANDGSSIAIASMIDGLLKNNVSVSLLTLNTKKHFKTSKQISDKQPDELALSAVEADTDIKPVRAAINLLDGKPFHVSRFYLKSFSKKLKNLLAKETFDIIQLEGLAMMVYYDVIRRHSNAKITLRAHNVEYQIWERHIKNETNPLKKGYLKLQVKRLKKFELKAITQVDALVAITPEDEKRFRKLNPTLKTTSIPCGINLDLLKPISNQEKKYDLVYLASFDWQPNVQGVLWFAKNVWPLLQQKLPEITFSLGGRYMPNSIVKLQDQGIDIQKEVLDMTTFINSGTLVVVPLLAGSGMRIKIIENLALGKCQVSTQIGAEGVDVQSGYDILIANKPEEFVNAIVDLLGNSETRLSIEKNAQTTAVSKYDNHILGRDLINFYSTQVC